MNFNTWVFKRRKNCFPSLLGLFVDYPIELHKAGEILRIFFSAKRIRDPSGPFQPFFKQRWNRQSL